MKQEEEMIAEYESAMNTRLSGRDKELMVSVLQWADFHPVNQWRKMSDDVVTISKDRYEQLLQYEQVYLQRQELIRNFIGR